MSDTDTAVKETACLIVGSGIAGLMAARELHRKGVHVIVLEKSRGVGGRMATRRFAGAVFDHGTQYFAPSSPWFQSRIREWIDDGIVAEWFRVRSFEMDPRFLSASRYCGAPAMTAIPKHLGAQVEVHTGVRVTEVEQDDQRWAVHTDQGETYHARSCILTAPAPQTLALLDASENGPLSAEHRTILTGIQYEPCLTLLGTCDGAPKLPPGGVLEFERGNLRRIMDNAAKGISPVPALTVHAMGEYSEAHFDDDEADLLALLRDEIEPLIGTTIHESQLHRWRYSQVVRPHHAPMLMIEREIPLVVAGDGFGVNGVEGAARSGLQAAQTVMRHLA